MRACVIDCTADKFMTRGSTRKTSSSAYSTGMKCIERDFLTKYGGRELPRADLQNIRFFDIAFLSLTSVQEVESFVIAASHPDFRKNKTKIIAGGAGCINIYPLIDHIDIAVFGRCDSSQIIDIINGEYGKNVWAKESDPECKRKYEVGDFKPPKLNVETGTIGCRMRCAYCQYTHVRKHDKLPYSPEKGAAETDIWASDFSRPRVYTTAIDGLSEETRRKVNKPITNEFLLKKVSEFYSDANRGRSIGIKFYNIVGYPWETFDSIKKDFAELVKMLSSLDRKTGKWQCKIMFQHTPFSPEPLTPMEKCNIDPHINFTAALREEHKGVDISIKNTPFLQGHVTRLKRMAINRCTYENRQKVNSFLMGEMPIDEIMPIVNNNNQPAPYLIRPVEYNTNQFLEWEGYHEL